MTSTSVAPSSFSALLSTLKSRCSSRPQDAPISDGHAASARRRSRAQHRSTAALGGPRRSSQLESARQRARAPARARVEPRGHVLDRDHDADDPVAFAQRPERDALLHVVKCGGRHARRAGQRDSGGTPARGPALSPVAEHVSKRCEQAALAPGRGRARRAAARTRGRPGMPVAARQPVVPRADDQVRVGREDADSADVSRPVVRSGGRISAASWRGRRRTDVSAPAWRSDVARSRERVCSTPRPPCAR